MPSRPAHPRRRALALGVAGALTVALTATATAPADAATRGVRLLSTADTVDAYSYDGYVYIDPSIWLASYGQGLEFRASRARVSDPVTLTRTVVVGSRRTTTTVPSRLVDGMNGLKDGLTMTVTSPAGKVLTTSTGPLCPGSYERQRVDQTGPSQQVYPDFCGGAWFTKATVFGIEQGWAVRPEAYLDLQTSLTHLVLTVSVSDPVADYLGIPAGDRTVTQQVEVQADDCEFGCRQPAAQRAAARAGAVNASGQRLGRSTATDAAAASRPASSTTRRAAPQVSAAAPAADTVPDLISVPAWGIGIETPEEGEAGAPGRLDFNANEWNAGPAPMVVEGFRRGTQPVMDAYQMFYRDGQVVGSRKTGTMEFHDAPEHHHWHFLDFARYDLVKPDGTLVTTSGKQSWCLAPTDPVDLSLKTAVWRPETTGLETSCGDEGALWLRETMPVGWGDTYNQYQTSAFDLTGVPNGRYRIKVTVNPNGNLYETTRANNVSLRTVILGGKPGARTVTVPPYQGVDTEVGFGEGGL